MLAIGNAKCVPSLPCALCVHGRACVYYTYMCSTVHAYNAHNAHCTSTHMYHIQRDFSIDIFYRTIRFPIRKGNNLDKEKATHFSEEK